MRCPAETTASTKAVCDAHIKLLKKCDKWDLGHVYAQLFQENSQKALNFPRLWTVYEEEDASESSALV